MRLRGECSILIAVAVLALPGPSSAQTERPRAVVTTPHFAVFSDLAANLNDALIAAGRARRVKRQELFQTGPEKACFDNLTAAERAGGFEPSTITPRSSFHLVSVRASRSFSASS